jgi:hypothetical protein
VCCADCVAARHVIYFTFACIEHACVNFRQFFFHILNVSLVNYQLNMVWFTKDAGLLYNLLRSLICIQMSVNCNVLLSFSVL